MRSKIKGITLTPFAIFFSIAALAAEAAAPAAQSTVWTFDDYLRGALSGAAGGLISGLVALVIGWMNNRNALKINQQKIDADHNALEINHKKQIEKLCYEEKRKLCNELLAEINKFTFVGREFNIEKVSKIYSRTSMTCGFRYGDYVRQTIEMVVNDDILKKYFSQTSKKDSMPFDDKELYMQRLNIYEQFYNSFVIITQKMLAGEELLPAREWNLDDFEGSIPIDYRRNLP